MSNWPYRGHKPDCYDCEGRNCDCAEEARNILAEEVEILKEAMMAELPDDPKRPDTAEAYAKEFIGCAESWENACRMSLKKAETYGDFFRHYGDCEKCGPNGSPDGTMVICPEGDKLWWECEKATYEKEN